MEINENESFEEFIKLLESEFDIDIEYSYTEDVNEGHRPPRISKVKRKGNTVKSQAMKELTGPDSKVKMQIAQIFKAFDKLVRKHAAILKTPKTAVNVDKITIRRNK